MTMTSDDITIFHHSSFHPGTLRFLKGDQAGRVIPCPETDDFFLGSDEDAVDFVVSGEDICPVHLSVRYDSLYHMYAVKDYSSEGTYMDNDVQIPPQEMVYLPEGSILYVGGSDTAILLGDPSASAYLDESLPEGCMIRSHYMITGAGELLSRGLVYPGLDLTDGTRVDIYCERRVEGRDYSRIHSVPGTIKIYEVLCETELIFYICKFMEGATLRSVMDDYGSMHIDNALGIIYAVMDTLEIFHRQGHYFGTLSPYDIYILNTGEVKIMTSGRIPLLPELDHQDSANMGNRIYMAPELFGQNSIRKPEQCDVYTVSAIFYEMITGSPPPGPSARMPQDNLLPPIDYEIDIYEDQSNVILNGLNMNPHQRTGSIREMKRQLSSIKEVPRH